MESKTMYTVGEKEFTDSGEAIKYEATLYGKALEGAGFSGPGLQRKVNSVEEFLTYQETGKLPEVRAKKASKAPK
jgi:hypothetical protein